MPNANFVPRDLYLKQTDPTGAKAPILTQHRVWDAEMFIAGQVAQHDSPTTKPEDRRLISVVTLEDYRAANPRRNS